MAYNVWLRLGATARAAALLLFAWSTIAAVMACAGPTLGGSTGGAATTTSSAGGTTGTGGKSVCPAPDPPPPDTSTGCPAPVEEPCMRYHIPLVGNPSTDVALRNKYIAAFGSACYMSDSDPSTFGCFYKQWPAACDDAAKIGQVSGNAPYDQGHMCQPDGAGNYTLQIGADVANKIVINYQAAPRQTPLVEVDGGPTEVNGPYRNLTEPATLGPGNDFYCPSGMVDADGGSISQRNWILQVNKKAHDGGIHSDLAGFKWLCKRKDEDCKEVVEECEELLVLADPDDKENPPFDPGAIAQVHHVVPMNDKRSCSWGTNSNKNAAVISAKLNKFFTNNNPPVEEVKMLNNAKPYPP